VARSLCGAHLKRLERWGDVAAGVPLGGRMAGPTAVLPPGLLTVEAAAAQVGLTPKGVRTSIERRKLPATKIEGRWAIKPEDLAAWVAQRRRK
jgi:excisionase family DNA binding protein